MSFNLNVGGLGNVGVANAVGGLPGVGCRSIFGLLFGLVLIPGAFGLLYWGEFRLVNHGQVFERYALGAPEAAIGQDGLLVKIHGKPSGKFLKAPRYRGPVVYWRTDLEQYEQERDSDGKTTYEWHTVKAEHQWAPFSLGPIQVTPDKANPVGERTIFKGQRRPTDRDFTPDRAEASPQVGDQRLTVEVMDAAQDLIIMGQVQGKAIADGSTFVVSALDDAKTTEALKTEYRIAYWLMKGGAVLALWLGILAFLGPLMGIVGWIPLIGERITGLFAFSALFIAAGIVALLTVAMKFFWLIAALALVLLLVIVWRGATTPRQRPVPPPPPPVTA